MCWWCPWPVEGAPSPATSPALAHLSFRQRQQSFCSHCPACFPASFPLTVSPSVSLSLWSPLFNIFGQSARLNSRCVCPWHALPEPNCCWPRSQACAAFFTSPLPPLLHCILWQFAGQLWTLFGWHSGSVWGVAKWWVFLASFSTRQLCVPSLLLHSLSLTLSSSPRSVRSFLLSIICVPLRCFFFVALFWTLPFISCFHFVSVFIPLFLRLFFSREFWTFAFDSAFSKFFGFGGFKRDIFPAAPVLLVVAVHSLFFVISFYAALCLSHAQLQQKINNNKNKIKGKVQGEKLKEKQKKVRQVH